MHKFSINEIMDNGEKLSPLQEKQLEAIKNHYFYLEFIENKSVNCPAWDILDDKKTVGLLFYFGDWRISSDTDYWGQDIEQFLDAMDTHINDIEE